MAVPLSPEELRAKRNSILKHQSQMESAPFPVSIQLNRLLQKIVKMYTFSGTNKIGRTELHTIPELLQQVLQLLFPYIVHIYHHRKQLMGILLRMCLSVKTDGWYQPKPVPYDLIQHFQTVINHPLPSVFPAPELMISSASFCSSGDTFNSFQIRLIVTLHLSATPIPDFLLFYRKNEKKNDAMISTIPPPTRLESCA